MLSGASDLLTRSLSHPRVQQMNEHHASEGEILPVDSQGETGFHLALDDTPSPEDPPPSLRAPFFTMVHDVTSGEHHHPHVHYVFSDDDPDIITNAILQNLYPDGAAVQSPASAAASTDRHIIVDLDENGEVVISAKSLNHDWQIINTSIIVAPTFDESSSAEEAGMMLRIEGVESTAATTKGNLAVERFLQHRMNAPNIEGLTAAMSTLAGEYRKELATLRSLSTQAINLGGSSET